ncbi:DUF881 domain-containing protein [Alteribacter salitolerans]|uniref:DUF881 domain-containing protein n=1 Tax=Alteribacter salitolerans TaxID=2912333 RepID=UPI001F419D76|nr:DUF881 domain-containing protein [Alteribacter salitolerans]
MKVKVKGSHVVLSFVLLFAGFLIAFSYQLTSDNSYPQAAGDSQWKVEDDLRNNILMQQSVNRNLTEELRLIQAEMSRVEEEVANHERRYFNLVEDMDKLRMLTGAVAVIGEGIEITLDDAEFVPDDQHANNFIVHEQHVQKVIDELLVTGAEAIAVNGHRINQNSYIQCIGPVIEIDGNRSFAPFTITAIGESEQLNLAVNLSGGVVDQLVQDNVEVRVEKKNDVLLDPFYEEGDMS